MSANEHQTVGDASHTQLDLMGNQDVRVAGQLHRNLIELLAHNEPVSIHCTGVDSVDASALQLLLAAKREAGDSLEIVAADDSEAGTWFRLAGVRDKLQLKTSAGR